MPEEIVMRHRIPQFGHIFSSDGYAAGITAIYGLM
jgi:peptidyl-dipeptidase Dcp